MAFLGSKNGSVKAIVAGELPYTRQAKRRGFRLDIA